MTPFCQMMLVFDGISGAMKAFSRSRSQKVFIGALQKTEKINSGAQVSRSSFFPPPCFLFFRFNYSFAGVKFHRSPFSHLWKFELTLGDESCVLKKISGAKMTRNANGRIDKLSVYVTNFKRWTKHWCFCNKKDLHFFIFFFVIIFHITWLRSNWRWLLSHYKVYRLYMVIVGDFVFWSDSSKINEGSVKAKVNID